MSYLVYGVATSTGVTVSPNPATSGSPVVVTAKVSPLNAAGTIQFLDGSTKLGNPVAVSFVTGGTATMTTKALAKGTHTLSAQFAPTDPTAFGPSTSPAVILTVK